MRSARPIRVIAAVACLAALVVIGRALRVSGDLSRAERHAESSRHSSDEDRGPPTEPSLRRESVPSAEVTPQAELEAPVEEARVEAGATISGRVYDVATTAPIAGAEVSVERSGGKPTLTRFSDAQGAYRFEGLESGHLALDVRHEHFSIERPIEIELAANARLVRDVALTGADRVTGRVIDAATRAPIQDAEIAITFGRTTVRTAGDGRFVFDSFLRHAYVLSARAPGYATIGRTIRKFPSHELTNEVEFALPREQRARGLVVDPAARPMPDVTLEAIATDYAGEGETQRMDTASASSDANGRFEIAGLRPDMRHVLLVRAGGFARLRFDFPADAARQEVVDFGVIALREGAMVRISVVDELDSPKKNFPVTLHGGNDDRRRLDPNREEDALIDLYVAEQTERTDPEGVAAFDDVAPGDYKIQALVPGTHRTQTMNLRVLDNAPQQTAKFVVASGLAISGVVKVSDGGTLPKCYVSIDPENGQESNGDAECDTNGHFEATALLPGPYGLTIYPYASEDDKRIGRAFDPVKLKGVEAGRKDVDVVLEPKK